jgi:hypothetical protein
MYRTNSAPRHAVASRFAQPRRSRRRPGFGARRRFRFEWERVEERTLLSVLTVNTVDDNTTDTSVLTLRDAITLVNTVGDPTSLGQPTMPAGWAAQIDNSGGGFGTNDTIDFAIPGTGVQTIAPTAPLPTITHPVVINGYSQSNTQAKLIQLSGPGMTSGVTGLDLATSGSTVQGLVINQFSIAINVVGNNNQIQGNFVGTDPTGTEDFWPVSTSYLNGPPIGVQVSGSGNSIGTGVAAGRNIISGSNYGVVLSSTTQSVVAGNYIGTDLTGTHPLGNWAGIGLLGGATGDRIGVDPNSSSPGDQGNLISANDIGILLGAGVPAPAAVNTGIYGNEIGTDVNGTNNANLGNQWTGVGVAIGSQGCSIGSESNPALGNNIAFNGGGWSGASGIKGPGVWIAPFLGTPDDIRVQGNSIHDNAGLGIDIGGNYPSPGPDGVNNLATPDGPGTGANNLQHYPVLQTAQGGPVSSIRGTLSSNDPGPFTLDFYASAAANPSGYGEGARYLGSTTIGTAGSFSVDLLAPTSPGEVISATATDANGNTSEFSQDVTAGSATSTGLQDVLTPGSSVKVTTTPGQFQEAIDAVDALKPVAGSGATLTIDLGAGTYGGQTLSPPAGVTVIITASNGGATFVGHSPALTVSSGQVIIQGGVTFTNSTAAPTILVTGGSLVLRNDLVEESDTSNQAAILITGGTVDLGTIASPGGNTINVNGAGELVHNASGNPVSAVGTTFTINGVPVGPSSLSGVVFADFNDDGQVDFGEQGIAGVTINLDGTDFLGNPVHLSLVTDSDGAYVFQNLLLGTYMITAPQVLAGYTQGINSVGTGGGTVSGDQFTVTLTTGQDAMNYNFGEQPAATGPIQHGQTAGIGFWNNKNGQALIKALNGGGGTQLGDWLATTFPHMFGALSGSNNLAGKTNAYVASFFQSRFVVKDQKLDAQVLATALAVYVTDGTLDNTGVGAQYGFIVGGNGVATATFNVGSNGAAFGVADNTVMTVLDILLAADAQAVNGVLYNGTTAKRNMANTIFSAINQAGGIN